MAELSNQPKKNIRIGIIGAGPAGLAAAEYLHNAGYHNYTIIEKTNHPGGMSLSQSYATKDGRELIYELGSFQPTASKNLYKLLEKNNLHIGKQNTGKNTSARHPLKIKIYSLKEDRAIVDFSKYLFGFPITALPAILPQGIRFGYYLLKYSALVKPGYNQIDAKQLEVLSISYEKWLDQKNFKSLDIVLRMMGSIATFSNPENRGQIALIANIKVFLNLLMLPTRYLNGHLKFVKEGYQELWNRVAKNHNILFNAVITSVTRKPDEIEVRLTNKTLTFDKLIVTCSPTQALTFLDATEEEKCLFNKVHYSPGWRAAFLAKNLPHDALYSLIEPYLDNKDAKPGLQTFYPEGQVDDNVWLYTCVINSNKNEDSKLLFKEAEKLLHDKFGGTVLQWLNSCYWPEYVPYFLSPDIKNNIFQSLEDLQGKNNTFYLGGTFSGSAQAIVIDYAYDRLKKFFA